MNEEPAGIDGNGTAPPSRQLQLTHFGAAAWRITDGQTTVYVDPYFLEAENREGVRGVVSSAKQ